MFHVKQSDKQGLSKDSVSQKMFHVKQSDKQGLSNGFCFTENVSRETITHFFYQGEYECDIRYNPQTAFFGSLH